MTAGILAFHTYPLGSVGCLQASMLKRAISRVEHWVYVMEFLSHLQVDDSGWVIVKHCSCARTGSVSSATSTLITRLRGPESSAWTVPSSRSDGRYTRHRLHWSPVEKLSSTKDVFIYGLDLYLLDCPFRHLMQLVPHVFIVSRWLFIRRAQRRSMFSAK